MYPALFKNLILPLYEKIKGKKLLTYVNQYQSHLSLSKAQLEKHQWHELKKLLQHAYDNTTFYPEIWAKAGFHSVDDIQSMADFEKLPFVTKDDIAKHYQALVAKNYSKNIKKATGGSTGQPFRFELNVDSNTRREAIMWRGYGWLGAGLGVKTLYLWGADIGQPTKLKALKNNLYHAFYNRKIDNKLSVFSPKTILTGAEPLHDFQREVIEKAFNCNVYNTFGCREFMLMSAECREHKNLHINIDHLVVETVSEDGLAITGESGDLVVTDLYNYGMPLIRYLNGDRATLVNSPCSCNNPLPIMKSIDGRKLDIIKTPSGKKIPGELFPHLFKEFENITRFQVKQSKINELDIAMIINQKLSADDEQKIKDEINKYADNELTLHLNFVDDIPLTVSGKHRVTICEI